MYSSRKMCDYSKAFTVFTVKTIYNAGLISRLFLPKLTHIWAMFFPI